MKMRRLSVFEVGAMKLITPACFAWHVIKITANVERTGACSIRYRGSVKYSYWKMPVL